MNRQQNVVGITSQKRELICVREEAKLVAVFLCMRSVLSWREGGTSISCSAQSQREHSFMNVHPRLRCPGWGISTPLFPEPLIMEAQGEVVGCAGALLSVSIRAWQRAGS